MRDYGRLSPRLYTGRLGQHLKGDADALALAPYLIGGPHANLIGLYHLPEAYVVSDLGLTAGRVRAAMAKLSAEHAPGETFLRVDSETERVWVVEHARHELLGLREALAPGDKRIPYLQRLLRDQACSVLCGDFFSRYGKAFHLSPIEAPSIPHRRGFDGVSPESREVRSTKSESLDELANTTSAPSDSAADRRRLRAAEERAEIEWRLEQTWAAHLEMRRRHFEAANGKAPGPPPKLTAEIRKAIRDSLREHDSDLLRADQRDAWTTQSHVRAAGIGLFLDDFHAGRKADSDGTTYLEPWRPWKRQRGKPDPVHRFAPLYFQAKES